MLLDQGKALGAIAAVHAVELWITSYLSSVVLNLFHIAPPLHMQDMPGT